jgi:two-component system, NtrC family, sensor kinase
MAPRLTRDPPAPMRVATRLMLLLVATVVVAVLAYMMVSHQQRQELLRGELVRDTETLGRALQAGINHSLRRDERIEGLDEMLRAAVVGADIFASVLLDPAGEVVAGEAADLTCLRRHIPAAVLASGAGSGWANCAPEVYWVALPILPPASAVVVAQTGALLDRSVSAELRRQLLLLFALLLTVLGLFPQILRGRLVGPLGEIMRGIRVLGERGEMPPIRVDRSAGELSELAATLNQVAEQLAEQRHQLVHQSEEKLALERRLLDAEKFAVIGRLSSGLAHELGSPLSVIAIRAQAIRYTPRTLPAVQEHADVIHSQVRRVSDFIQGLLHMAQEHGVVFNPLDLTELLSELLEEIEPRARTAEVRIDLVVPDAPVTVLGERALLRHAIHNLLRNALDALGENVSERRVQVRIEEQVHEVRLFVEDTGPGIPEAHLANVLKPFYTTKGMGRGMGLGLPITRGIIEEHGGELYLENLRHRGLRAVMVLPVRNGTPGSEAAGDELRAVAAATSAVGAGAEEIERTGVQTLMDSKDDSR